jgi:hypothetical protein
MRDEHRSSPDRIDGEQNGSIRGILSVARVRPHPVVRRRL